LAHTNHKSRSKINLIKILGTISTFSLFQKWQLGTVFIPDSLGYLIGTNFFGTLSYTMGQWRMAILATLLVGISAIMVSVVMINSSVCNNYQAVLAK